jgi:hypothetical protein
LQPIAVQVKAIKSVVKRKMIATCFSHQPQYRSGFIPGALIGSTLPAPSGQVGGVNPFLAQQGSNLTRLGTAISGIQDAALVVAGKLPALGRGNYLRVEPRAGGRVSSRLTGVFQRALRRS